MKPGRLVIVLPGEGTEKLVEGSIHIIRHAKGTVAFDTCAIGIVLEDLPKNRYSSERIRKAKDDEIFEEVLNLFEPPFRELK